MLFVCFYAYFIHLIRMELKHEMFHVFIVDIIYLWKKVIWKTVLLV